MLLQYAKGTYTTLRKENSGKHPIFYNYINITNPIIMNAKEYIKIAKTGAMKISTANKILIAFAFTCS